MPYGAKSSTRVHRYIGRSLKQQVISAGTKLLCWNKSIRVGLPGNKLVPVRMLLSQRLDLPLDLQRTMAIEMEAMLSFEQAFI
jgi:hypothetical protein